MLFFLTMRRNMCERLTQPDVPECSITCRGTMEWSSVTDKDDSFVSLVSSSPANRPICLSCLVLSLWSTLSQAPDETTLFQERPHQKKHSTRTPARPWTGARQRTKKKRLAQPRMGWICPAPRSSNAQTTMKDAQQTLRFRFQRTPQKKKKSSGSDKKTSNPVLLTRERHQISDAALRELAQTPLE